MDFSNRPNWQATSKDVSDGRWISRSCAVLVIPFFHTLSGEAYVPLGKRADCMPQHPGSWGLPCGYLDWDESLAACGRREVFEEIGLELGALDIRPQPDYVASEPMTDSLQNVTHRFIVHKFLDNEALPLLKPGREVSEARWFDVSKLREDTLDYAFNHLDIIQWALKQ